ncbi:MAG: hypothetical protein U0931_20205 [Vulcanimicrobiota bacterium]
MKKNLSTLCFAGLVALTGLVATGCGSDDATFVNTGSRTSIREYAVIPNFGNNSITIKSVNIQDGTSSVLNNSFTQGVANQPFQVKTHPNINVFYVLHKGTANVASSISQYTMDGNGGVAFLGSVATPANPMWLAIHPSGGLVYVGAANNGNAAAGSIRRYTVASNGTLTAVGADVATTNFITNNFQRVQDVDFGFGGGTLHVPEVNKIETFTIASDGSLTASGQVNGLTNAAFEAADIDVRPGQASLVAVVRTNEATDRVMSFPLNNGVLGAIASNISTTETRLNMGDFASNGQYYLGSSTNPRVLGYNLDTTTSVMTALATNPMTVATGARAQFVNLDPSNNFIVSTGGGIGDALGADNVLVARFRGQNGEFTGSTADSQALNIPGAFDYFNFNF